MTSTTSPQTFAYNNAGDKSLYTGDTIAAGVLTPGHQYQYDIFFSSRYSQAGAGFGGATATEGFDYTTYGQFTAQAVPEPATMLALAAGFAAIAKRRRK